MNFRKMVYVGMISLVAITSLVACSGKKEETKEEDITTLPIKTSNQKAAEDGGVLKVAVVSDGQIRGLFDRSFANTAYDDYFMEPSHEMVFSMNNNFETTDDGIAKKEIDIDNKKITITINKENVKWSDGEDLVAEDLIEPYLVICSPDAYNEHYGSDFMNIVGAEEYHEGKSDTISGIKKMNDKSIEITYKEMNPGMKQNNSSVWSSAMPYHIFKDIPVAEMESSDAVRKKPVTLGPYKMSKVVTGESVEYTPNEYYYGEKPKLDKIEAQIVASSSIIEALKAKQYDMVLSMPTETYQSYKDIDGYEILGKPDLAYTYLAFRLGTYDTENGENVYNPESKMANKSLRQAMGYALDNKTVGEKFHNGLRPVANAIIPPVFPSFTDKELVGFSKQDIEKANKLLDDAGYLKKEGEEYRRGPDGNELVINFASTTGGDVALPLAEYYIDAWKEIGLNVQLATGRLIEFNAFYDKLQNDDPEIDVFQAAWSIRTDPSQSNLYSKNAAFNFSRFVSDENTELLDNIDSEKAFDNDYRVNAFKEWQEYVADEAFVIPTTFTDAVRPVSNRVTNYDWSYDVINPWASIGLTE